MNDKRAKSKFQRFSPVERRYAKEDRNGDLQGLQDLRGDLQH